MNTASTTTSWKAATSIPHQTALVVCFTGLVSYFTVEFMYLLGTSLGNVLPFWPVTPFLVAILLLTPRSVWSALIAVGLGALALFDFRIGTPPVLMAWNTVGNLIEVLGVAFGIASLYSGAPQLTNLTTLIQFSAFAVIASFASAFFGANSSLVGDYWLQWRLWFFGDVLGFLSVTPAILAWVTEGRAWSRSLRNLLELAALACSFLAVGYLAFLTPAQMAPPALLYSLVPLLLWAALRLGLKGVSASIILVAFLAFWGASHDRGPFTGQGPLDNALSLQLFLVFAALPFIFLAVLAGQQKQAEGERLKMLEEIAHLDRVASMGQMAASLAHELAQPLAAILSNAQAATRFANRPWPNMAEIRGALAEITEDDQRARAFLQNMRQMFQRQAFVRAPVDLNKIVDDVSRLVRNEAAQRGVQIRVLPFPDPVVVLADATALQQVILNLVNNGMDALQDLPSEFRVLTLIATVQANPRLGSVLVADNGRGVPRENRQKLFAPFFTTKSEGLGMGLSICRTLVESFGGRITLLDRPEPGSIFLVELPLATQKRLATSA